MNYSLLTIWKKKYNICKKLQNFSAFSWTPSTHGGAASDFRTSLRRLIAVVFIFYSIGSLFPRVSLNYSCLKCRLEIWRCIWPPQTALFVQEVLLVFFFFRAVSFGLKQWVGFECMCLFTFGFCCLVDVYNHIFSGLCHYIWKCRFFHIESAFVSQWVESAAPCWGYWGQLEQYYYDCRGPGKSGGWKKMIQ